MRRHRITILPERMINFRLSIKNRVAPPRIQWTIVYSSGKLRLDLSYNHLQREVHQFSMYQRFHNTVTTIQAVFSSVKTPSMKRSSNSPCIQPTYQVKTCLSSFASFSTFRSTRIETNQGQTTNQLLIFSQAKETFCPGPPLI